MAKRKKSKNQKRNKRLFWIFILIILSISVYWYYEDIYQLIFPGQHIKGNYTNLKVKLHDYSVFGIDVSQYQEEIDWEKLSSEEKPSFVFIRASVGKNFKDTNFDYNWSAAKNHEIIRGAYHYYRPNENSKEQAEIFINTVNLSEGDLPPILDIEKYSKVQDLPKLKNALLNWLLIVEEHYQVTPILYTYNKFYVNTFANDKRFDKYLLWIAWYNVKDKPDKISNQWLFWQFTDKARIKGIKGDVDMNVFNGNLNDLELYRIKKL